MIKFITEEEKHILSFRDVEDNQFFVKNNGSLCQKISIDQYNVVALKDGDPCGVQRFGVDPEEKIRKILPKVYKIVF